MCTKSPFWKLCCSSRGCYHCRVFCLAIGCTFSFLSIAELSMGPFMKNQGYLNGSLITVFNYHHRWTKVTRCWPWPRLSWTTCSASSTSSSAAPAKTTRLSCRCGQTSTTSSTWYIQLFKVFYTTYFPNSALISATDCAARIFLPPYAVVGFEPTIELDQTGTFEGRSSDWAIALRQIIIYSWSLVTT